MAKLSTLEQTQGISHVRLPSSKMETETVGLIRWSHMTSSVAHDFLGRTISRWQRCQSVFEMGILICDSASNELRKFYSHHGATVVDVLRQLGDGNLSQGGAMIAASAFVLGPGKHTWETNVNFSRRKYRSKRTMSQRTLERRNQKRRR